ncbi:N-acetyl-gamma-glutamyl-phosphate reductase [Parerythrobacter jejuensis]|uniref:N-acetyl-gamma-glutamyl-phosphate reductase n=1 Tax=Parerythrobacter jejuensis TaxID=795812 RepID=A0A845ALG7_9SPHN|nr:N-acetyl-gamma-glutamyl-phosphate reductase [Parerythrobacter jejuensis]MXP31622.1 N-acetyl-gamma-glutamyl-phosphate reductase [Parerythrobacter jejuensis]
MGYSVFIDGAAGTTGLEIRDRLQGRSEFHLVVLDDAQRKDPDARRDALNSSDFAILCLPDEAAIDAVSLIDPASHTRVIDASSAHRVADGWTYGFPELVGRDQVANAKRISNPGCYPTGFLALISPLVRNGLLPADWPFTCNAVSGFSGGGKPLIERFNEELDLAYRTYGLALDHKHRPEMQKYAGLKHEVLFAPSVVPAFRGMLVEVPLHLGAMSTNPHADSLRDALRLHYASSPVVTVNEGAAQAELTLNSDPDPWDGVELFVFANADSGNARLVARLDNLGKGASGAAVQSLNLMAGLDETTGLRLPKK